jgi:hypothetical protein
LEGYSLHPAYFFAKSSKIGKEKKNHRSACLLVTPTRITRFVREQGYAETKNYQAVLERKKKCTKKGWSEPIQVAHFPPTLISRKPTYAYINLAKSSTALTAQKKTHQPPNPECLCSQKHPSCFKKNTILRIGVPK